MDSFSNSLDLYLTELSILQINNSSEDMIRSTFLKFLCTAFPSVNSNEIDLERHIPLPSHTAGAILKHGFADAVYGDIIFEFKKKLDINSAMKGKYELQKYLLAFNDSITRFGLLTDGEQIQAYVLRDSTIEQLDTFNLRKDNTNDIYLRLDTYLFQEKGVIPDAKDIALRFGEKSPVFWASYSKLHELWIKVSYDEEAKTKYIQWQNLISVVYGSQIGNIDLFIKHSYLVYFARVLAFSSIQQKIPNITNIYGIFSGEAFSKMGFPDFVSDDFFSWANLAQIKLEIGEWLNGLAVRLGSSYDLTQINEDLLKSLYQELVDPETRHDLGEFYTPDWLAELILEETNFPLKNEYGEVILDTPNSLFDPSCGSGTFLFTGIRMLKNAGVVGKELVDFVIKHFAGIDIHPLATIVAKTNILLAIGSELRGFNGTLRLPIFMANTLSLAMKDFESKYVSVTIDSETIAKIKSTKFPQNLASEFRLPINYQESYQFLDRSIDLLLDYGSPDLDSGIAEEGFRKSVSSVLGNSTDYSSSSLWISNLRLMRWLLSEPATDGVWKFILKNATRPELLRQRKYGFVVGNPPWLSYRYIESRQFQESIRKLVFKYNLLETADVNLYPQIELGTLFFAFCKENYLLDSGRIAFVLPRSILTGAKQHQNFQELYILDSDKIFDLKHITPLFKVPSCVIISQKDTTPKHNVPLFKYSGNLPGKNLSFQAAHPILKVEEKIFSRSIETTPSTYLDYSIQGATLVPRSFWFVQVPQDAKTLNSAKPFLESSQYARKNSKDRWKDVIIQGSVESQFLYLTLLSGNILPFGIKELSLLVLPIQKTISESFSEKERLFKTALLEKQDALKMGFPGLADWLSKVENYWENSSKKGSRVDSPYERINFNNNLVNQICEQKCLVIYNRSGTHIAACSFDLSMDIYFASHNLPVNGFIADSSTHYIRTRSMDEAYYLSTYLNAPFTDEQIKPYQTQGQFGALSGGGERDIYRLPFEIIDWPLFEENNPLHQELATIGKVASEKVLCWCGNATKTVKGRSIGSIRGQIRKNVIKEEIYKSEGIIQEILKNR